MGPKNRWDARWGGICVAGLLAICAAESLWPGSAAGQTAAAAIGGTGVTAGVTAGPVVQFPANGAVDVNPDTHLTLTFSAVPVIGTSGKIRIYDAADNRLVDTLDMSLPAGPAAAARGGRGTATRGASASATAPTPAATYTPVPYDYSGPRRTNANTIPGTPSGVAVATPATYQLTIIGGFTDAFHFYPIIVHDKTATIYPHNNLLECGKTYYVQIDPGVLAAEGFAGIAGKAWTFSTRKTPPDLAADRYVVAGDGSGDFNTVQGAIDFIPDHSPRRTTVFIKTGAYEEIVYFRNKSNLTLLGEDRENVVISYANNEVFNPHPANVLTNEYPGTFPSRRAAFMVDHSTGIQLVNFTVKTTAYGQAEGLLLVGGENIVSHVNVVGSGDALQVNDSAYFVDSSITGDGDTILTRGPAFFERCDLHSGGVFMWVRNTAASHGLVFSDCTFQPARTPGPTLARAPANNGRGYPNAEVVLLNCKLGAIDPAAWGPVGGETADMHFWEFQSTNLADGKPADITRRLAASRQLNADKDAQILANYRDPAFVLGGWMPKMAPLILHPLDASAPVKAAAGTSVTLAAKIAGIPAPSCQWLKNGSPIAGATQTTLTLPSVTPADAGTYSLKATNDSGVVTSPESVLTVIPSGTP